MKSELRGPVVCFHSCEVQGMTTLMVLFSISQQLPWLWRDGSEERDRQVMHMRLREWLMVLCLGVISGIHCAENKSASSDLRKVCLLIIFKQKREKPCLILFYELVTAR